MSNSNKQSFWTGTGKFIFQSTISAIVFNAFFVVILFATKTVEPSTDTYIGLIAGFIAICVTIVIGFQIYNAIDIRSKVAEIDKKSIEFKRLNDNLIEQTIEAKAMLLESFIVTFGDTAGRVPYSHKEKITFYISSYEYYSQRVLIDLPLKLLNEKYESILFNNLIKDVIHYIKNPESLDINLILKVYHNSTYLKKSKSSKDWDEIIDALINKDTTKIADLEIIKQKYIP